MSDVVERHLSVLLLQIDKQLRMILFNNYSQMRRLYNAKNLSGNFIHAAYII